MPLSVDRANEPDWSPDYQRDSPANRGVNSRLIGLP
jgi:hypothetical protein